MLKLGRFFASRELKLVFELAEEVAINSRRFSCRLKPRVKTPKKLLTLRSNQITLNFGAIKLFHSSAVIKVKKDEVEEFDEAKSKLYNEEFEKWKIKNKKTFLETVRIYTKHAKNRAGHVDFIKAALRSMKAYGVHRDLECYKKILNVLPKGVYISKNKWLASGMYFPRQQYAAIDLLQQMGNNGVSLDAEIGMIMVNIFGKNSVANQKLEHMLYWTIKWKNKSPFILPQTLPSDPILLAKIAIERITSVDLQTEISVFKTDTVKDSIDKTWIVSGQSPKQKKLLQKHFHEVPVIVEEGNLVWLRDKCINYFILKADGGPLPFVYPEDTSDISDLKSKFFNPNFTEKKKENPTVHEQDDGIIYAVCATGTSSKDSLLSWIRILEREGNPVLAAIPVLFRFHQKEKVPAHINEAVVYQCDP